MWSPNYQMMGLALLAISASGLPGMLAMLERSVLLSPAYPHNYDEALAIYALTGHANREAPLLWLNSSSQAPAMSTPVMWPYPEADKHWLAYLTKEQSMKFEKIADSSLCSVLEKVQAVKPDVVRGLVVYEESDTINSLPFIAVTASGVLDALPVTEKLQSANPCLHSLPVLLNIPAAASFANDIAAYQWGVEHLLANTSKRMQVGACRSWQNYSCGWNDPLGSAAIDVGIAERGFIHNLSPKDPEQAAVFAKILSHLDVGSVFTGWAEPESSMIGLLSKQGALQLCGAPNLSFLRILGSGALRLPHQRSTHQLDPSKHYLVFQSNEGDTPKNAYSFRGGNWFSPARGRIPMAWGVDPLIASFFPGLWDYYARTASPSDQFFAATGGLGYTYPWALPNRDEYFRRAGEAWSKYMPEPDNWVDLWEGGLNKSLYQQYRNLSNFTVDGFSQQTIGAAINTWLSDGTPLFVPDRSLWYPEDKGFCNKSLPLPKLCDCVEGLVQAVLKGKKTPFFVMIYGQDHYVDVALEMQRRLSKEVIIIGTQDLAELGRLAGRGFANDITTIV